MKAIVLSTVVCAIAISTRAQDSGPCSRQSATSEIRIYCQDLQSNRNSSLAHFRIAEVLMLQANFQTAANEFREALNGDLNPKWTEVWSHIFLGDIFTNTSQPERGVHEYRQARRTGDNTYDAQDEIAKRVGDSARFANLYTRADAAAVLSADYSQEARIAELEGTVWLDDDTVLQPLGLGLDENAIAAAVKTKTEGTRQRFAVDFFLTSKTSRWHLVGVTFHPPPNASRPEVLSTVYPAGAGISLTREIIERGSILAAIGRPATVTLGFDVDQRGQPLNIRVQRASDSIWADQAAVFVREWRFQPGLENGNPVPVPCSVDLLWGPRDLTAAMAETFSQYVRAR